MPPQRAAARTGGESRLLLPEWGGGGSTVVAASWHEPNDWLAESFRQPTTGGWRKVFLPDDRMAESFKFQSFGREIGGGEKSFQNKVSK